MNTADSWSRFTSTERTKAGIAHKVLRVMRLSILDMIDDVRLSTNGPTKRHANSKKQVLFLDFSMFCSKNSTNWITSEGKQCMEAMI